MVQKSGEKNHRLDCARTRRKYWDQLPIIYSWCRISEPSWTVDVHGTCRVQLVTRFFWRRLGSFSKDSPPKTKKTSLKSQERATTAEEQQPSVDRNIGTSNKHQCEHAHFKIPPKSSISPSNQKKHRSFGGTDMGCRKLREFLAFSKKKDVANNIGLQQLPC